MDLCWQSNVSAFEYAFEVGHNFPSKEKRLLISWLQSPSAVILKPPKIKSDTISERSYPMSEARGGGREDLPHAQGQGPRPGGATPPPRSGGCVGAGGPRGAILHSKSEGAAVRRYPSSKGRSKGLCWSSSEEITHFQG